MQFVGEVCFAGFSAVQELGLEEDPLTGRPALGKVIDLGHVAGRWSFVAVIAVTVSRGQGRLFCASARSILCAVTVAPPEPDHSP